MVVISKIICYVEIKQPLLNLHGAELLPSVNNSTHCCQSPCALVQEQWGESLTWTGTSAFIAAS
jgi:hypothetical protein